MTPSVNSALGNATPRLIPIQRQPETLLIRQWSRLDHINIRVTPQTVAPKHFGPGAQFWLNQQHNVPEDLRHVGLPDQGEPELAKLSTLYHDQAVRYYLDARREAHAFANNGMGIDFCKLRISPRVLSHIREKLFRALSLEPKFSEAWILLSRSISRQEKNIAFGQHQLSTQFVRSLAAVMANPLSAKMLMQLMSALPEPFQLPRVLTQDAHGQAMPLEKKRLAMYVLKYVDPSHEGALCALVECGGKVKLGKLLPVRQPQARLMLKADDIGAMAAFRAGELWPMMVSSQVCDPARSTVAIGNGAFLNKTQLQWLMRLETEEEDPNMGGFPEVHFQPQGRDEDEAGQENGFQRVLLERNQARATCLYELAQSLPSPTSWFYIPNHMLINATQMRSLAQTYQGLTGSYDRLRQACGDGSTSPIPIYRKTALTPAWINFYEKVMLGNDDPNLYRALVHNADQLPEQSIHQDQPYISIFGQAYSKAGLLLRADLFENRQKSLVNQSPVPALKLYLHYSNDIALHSSQNPVKIKQMPFVLNVGTQQASRLVQLLDERVLKRRGHRLEYQLTSALRDFLLNFNEQRTQPFRVLNDAQRSQDADFKKALTIVDTYAQMPERFQALQEQFAQRMTLANHLAQEAGTQVPEINFPSLPVQIAPQLCEACRESDQSEQNPLVSAPFDTGGHRLCLAEKMITTGQPDLRGILQDSPALSFLTWIDQAKEAIYQTNRFIRTLQSQSEQNQPQQNQDQGNVAIQGEAQQALAVGLGDAPELDNVPMEVAQAQPHHPPVDLEAGRGRAHPWDADYEEESFSDESLSQSEDHMSQTSESSRGSQTDATMSSRSSQEQMADR